MYVLGIILFTLSMLLMLALAVIVVWAILSFQPFDYRKVGYRAGTMFMLAMPLMMLGVSLQDGYLSPMRAGALAELLAMMLAGVLLAAFISYINFRFLRSFSETYARREAALAEKKRQQSSTADDECPAHAGERGDR